MIAHTPVPQFRAIVPKLGLRGQDLWSVLCLQRNQASVALHMMVLTIIECSGQILPVEMSWLHDEEQQLHHLCYNCGRMQMKTRVLAGFKLRNLLLTSIRFWFMLKPFAFTHTIFQT